MIFSKKKAIEAIVPAAIEVLRLSEQIIEVQKQKAAQSLWKNKRIVLERAKKKIKEAADLGSLGTMLHWKSDEHGLPDYDVNTQIDFLEEYLPKLGYKVSGKDTTCYRAWLYISWRDAKEQTLDEIVEENIVPSINYDEK